MRPGTAETVSVAQLRARLNQLGARFLPEKNPAGAKSHIYHSGPLKKWLRVKRHPQRPREFALIEYFDTCPCAFS